MKTKLKVIEIPADGVPTWYGGAFAHFFMYTKHKGNFILKGYDKEIEKWISDNNITHYIVNKTFFGNMDRSGMYTEKNHRSYWAFWYPGIYVSEPTESEKKYLVHSYNPEKVLKFKRLPKRWIPEYDLFQTK